MKTYDVKNLNAFFEYFEAKYAKMIETHQTLNSPINYEIEGDLIHPSHTNVYHQYTNLYKTMEAIADYTNNKLDCGCQFTIGF